MTETYLEVIVMIKWILQDVKRTIKSSKTYLLLAVIIISIISFLFNNMNQQAGYIEVNNQQGEITSVSSVHESYAEIFNMQYAFDFNCLSGSSDGPECNSYLTYMNYINILGTDISDQEEYELKLFLLDIATDDFITYYEQQNEDFKDAIDKKAIDIKLITDIKSEIKNSISPNYDSFSLDLSAPTITNFNKKAISLYETYVNYQNNYPLNIKYEMTSSFFLANYLNEFFLLIVLVTALVVFDSFYRDYQSGVIKTILSTPTRRYRYVVMKTI